MIENMNSVKKVDVFNDIVSRLEDTKKARVSDDVVTGMKNYYNNKQDYRSRVNLLANNLNGVKPIDNQVNNVIYLSDFMEKGIAIKTSLNSFKQIWVEYRLIFNEKKMKEESSNNIKLDTINKDVYTLPNLVDTLDSNYKKLYTKVVNLNKYVEDFNKKKLDLNRQIANLENRKRNLSNEIMDLENAKKEFERYKVDEQKKIDNLKTEVNSKVVSLQNLIDNLDDILGKVN